MRVVIADDEELVRYGIRDMLAEVSVPVSVVGEAESGRQLVELCRRLKPDLAIVDIRMPQMGGLEAIESLRAEGSEADWILLTSYSEFEYARRAVSLGAAEYLLKPVGPDELETALRSVAERRTARWAAANERFESRIAALVTGGGTDTGSEGWIYAVVLLLVDSSLPDEQVRRLRNNVTETMKAAVSDLIGPQVRVALCAIDADRIAGVMAWDGPFPQRGAAESLQERFEGRLARVARGFARPHARLTVVTSQPVGSLEAVLSLVERLKRLAPMRSLLGFGESVSASEITEIGVQEVCETMASRLAAAVSSWKTGRPLAFEESMREAAELYLEEPMLRTPAIERTIGNYLTALVSGSLGSLRNVDEWLPPLLAKLVEERPADREGAGGVIDQVTRYLEENYTKNVSIAKIAGMLDLTPNYLSALFHQRRGTTFTKYLTRLRMERARGLLLDGRSTVREIASIVGYASTRHFARTFKSTFDCYPSELRRASQD